MEDDEGCGDEAHGEDDADGVEERDADLADHLRVQLLLRVVHRVVRHRHPEPARERNESVIQGGPSACGLGYVDISSFTY